MSERIVLVTGGTSGIGLAVARRFLQNGDIVVSASIDPAEKALQNLAAISDAGAANYMYLDVTDESNCERAIESVANKYGRIDVLVTAAGVRGRPDPALDSDFNDIRGTMEVNVMGSVIVSVLTARRMVERRSGVIININSRSGFFVTAPDIGYHCSKAAVNMLTQVLAEEVSPFGVRCVGVAPGGVAAGMHSKEWEDKIKHMWLTGKPISPDEMAEIIFLLASDEASAINGSTVLADAGTSCYKGVWRKADE